MIFILPLRVHLQKNYYDHITAVLLPYEFCNQNFLFLHISKKQKKKKKKENIQDNQSYYLTLYIYLLYIYKYFNREKKKVESNLFDGF